MSTIRRHEAVEKWLVDSAIAWLSRPRTGLHVSSTITPRKDFFQSKFNTPLNYKAVRNFIRGRSNEDITSMLAKLGRHRQAKGIWEGISYTIDFLVPPEGGEPVPIEMKSSFRGTPLEAENFEQEAEYAFEQLGKYCAIRNSRIGYALQFYPRPREDSESPFRVFQIDFTPDDLERIRGQLRNEAKLLDEAKSTGDFSTLKECPKWMCGKEEEIKSAPICSKCGWTEQGSLKRKCPECRADLERPVFLMFTPECPFWDACKPARWQQHHRVKYHKNEEGG